MKIRLREIENKKDMTLKSLNLSIKKISKLNADKAG